MARTIERVPLERLRRGKKPAPKPPQPATAADMREALSSIQPPQVNVPAPRVTVQPPEVHVPPPQVTIQAPEVNVPAVPEMAEMLETARETRNLLLALLQSREGEIEVKVTGRDDDGAIDTLRILKQEIKH